MLAFGRIRFPAVVALVITMALLYVFFADHGSSGWWGILYNKLYIVLTWVTLGSAILLLTRRPWFALGLASMIIGGLWVGASIKYQFLGSQLVAPDLIVAALSPETLIEMGLMPTLIILGLLALLGLCAFLEKPFTRFPRKTYAMGLASALVLLALLNIPPFYIDLQWTNKQTNTLPIFVQSLWRAQLVEPRHPLKTTYCCFKADKAAETFNTEPSKKPNIIVILEESTFPLHELNQFKAEGSFFKDAYPLRVYTAGGSTWVQEIAFLHGVAPPLYGDGWQAVNLFAPGRLDGRIARQLANDGYATKTIYPTAGRFYNGRRFHEQLGMQEIIDCPAIEACRNRRWNKMPDEVFFDEALKQIKQTDKPLFAFVATMRQHSPHNKDIAYDVQRCKPGLTPKQCSILLDYNERLQQSVQSYENFVAKLKKLPERTIVVAFGDHIPGDVAANFVKENFEDQDRFRTFFNIWDSANGYVTRKALDGQEFATIDVAMLDAITLRYAGFESHYLTDKLVHMQKCSGHYCGFEDELIDNNGTALTQLNADAPPPSP